MPGCRSLADSESKVWDVIVLGAGPAGSLAAQQLAAIGGQVLLVDKRSFPRPKVCGGCLNARAIRILQRAGLAHPLAALGGTRIEEMELHVAGSCTRFDLPVGIAVSREPLDQALVEFAAASGAVFVPHTEGRIGPVDSSTRLVNLVQGGTRRTLRARVVLVATGLGKIRFADESPLECLQSPGSRIGAGCTVVDYPDTYREGTVFMAVGRAGYVGLVRVEEARLNIAAALDPRFLQGSGSPGYAANTLLLEAGCPTVPALEGATWCGTVALFEAYQARRRRTLLCAGRCRRVCRTVHGRGDGLGIGVRRGRRSSGLACRAALGALVVSSLELHSSAARGPPATHLPGAHLRAETSHAVPCGVRPDRSCARIGTACGSPRECAFPLNLTT